MKATKAATTAKTSKTGTSTKEFPYVATGQYNGNPILVIGRDENDRYPVQIGARKLKAILENLDAVRAFVAQHSK